MLRTLGLVFTGALASGYALKKAYMTDIEFQQLNHENQSYFERKAKQQAVEEAFYKFQKEMGLPDLEKMDDLDRKIFIVNAALQVKAYKENLSRIQKLEEDHLQAVVSSDLALQKSAEDTFKQRKKQLLNQYEEEFNSKVSVEISKNETLVERELKQLEEESKANMEQSFIAQRSVMVHEIMERFKDHRTKVNQIGEIAMMALKTKENNLKRTELSLEQCRSLAYVRILCQELQHCLSTKVDPAKDWTHQIHQVCPFLFKVVSAFPQEDALVHTTLSALPQQALERGVFTEPAIKERYYSMEQVAHRMAMLRDEGPFGGIMYLMSYLRSMLITQITYYPTNAVPIAREDTRTLDNTEILNRARSCLDHGDLPKAVAYIEQLQGVPKSVTHGWLQEARLLLHMQQATQILKNYASVLIKQACY